MSVNFFQASSLACCLRNLWGGGVDGHRRPKAVAHDADAGWVDLGTALQKIDGRLGVLHLFHADHLAALAFALAAATHVKTQSDIAQ